MLSTDIYNNNLSNIFSSKSVAAAQKIKPKVVAYWLESKNNQNVTISVDANNEHTSNAQGDLGYYFSASQAMNAFDRESFTWAVAGAKDVDGNVIKADGNWYVMPNDLADNYEFGWWSGSTSTANVHPTYGGYEFTNNPSATFAFDSRPCNLIKLFTSEYYGQIHTYRLTVRSTDAGAPNPVYTEVITLEGDSYFYEHFIPGTLIDGNSNTYINVNQVEIEILSTKNPEDYARVHEINVIYESDLSDDLVSLDSEKTRDLHVTELPIGGGSSSSVSLSFNNTSKKFNIFSNSSQYGGYVKKNIRIKSSIGWQVKKSNNLYIDGVLTSNISSSSNTISISTPEDFPDGGSGNSYVVIIDPENYTREYVLVSSKSGTYSLNVEQRGFNNSKARSHNANTKIRFETFEYPAYVESWVDEWQADSESMTINCASTDWTKFASEKIVTNGFFIEKATVADAVEGLLLTTNFPKKEIKSLNLYSKTAIKNKAVLHMNFSESVSDRSNTTLPIKNGLRARFFALPSSQHNRIKDITADALDRELSELEKALGNLSFTSADYTANSSDISSNTSNALDLVDFSFTDLNSETVDSYYNMVFDGFYVPTQTGDQYLGIAIAHGGVRVYLEDILILDEFFIHPVAAGVYEDIQSDLVNLIAGQPYKLRIECFHTVPTNATDTFSIYLQYAVGSDPLSIVPASSTYTMAALDRIGSKNAPYTAGSTDRGKTYNHGVYIGETSIGNEGGLVSDVENFSVKFEPGKYMRIPYDLSWDLNNSNSENYSGEWSIEAFVKPDPSYSTGFYDGNAWINDDGLSLPGVVGNYASSPDSAVLSISSDMEIVVRAKADDWTPASVQAFVSKWTGGVTQRSYAFQLGTSGQLYFGICDGVTNFSVGSSTVFPGVNGTAYWLKGTYVKDTGSGQYAIEFYYADDSSTEPTVWTKLGSTITGTSIGNLRDSTTALLIGGIYGGTSGMFKGEIYRSIVRNGVGGTTVFDADFSVQQNGATSFNEDSSNSGTVSVVSTYDTTEKDGDYISSFDAVSPTGGFEFYNTLSNGFRIKTSAGVEKVSASGSLPTDEWSHIVVTFDGSDVKYYLNGSLSDTQTLSGSISSWSDLDLGFGGRNVYYLVGTGEVGPSLYKSFFADQFIIYRECLTSDQIADRYTETNMQPLTTYPFLYGNEASVRDIIEEISLADLGRFYIDEIGRGVYEHFYAFFEPSIDKHANVQATISDESHIMSADYAVQLQTNKVVVKIAGLSTNLSGTQSLWRADSPTTLAVVNLESNIAANSESILVSTTVDPPFYNAGYLIIDSEIMKYSSKTSNSFNNLQRGMFGTTPASHIAGTPVREVRYWNLKYDKAPAFRVKDPFITGILFESPPQIDILKYNAGFYGAELIIAANTNVAKGSFVFAEGTDPITEKVAFTAIAGIPVLITDQGSQIEEQASELSRNIQLYGLKEVVIENKFITNFNHGQKIADFIISKMTEPVTILNVNTLLTPKVTVGDRIRISSMDQFDIINGDYWVLSKSMSYSDSPSQTMMIRKVV